LSLYPNVLKRVIFFDGPCPLCNQVVRWLMRTDRKKIFLFSSLQGKTAVEKNLPKDLSSLILLEEGRGRKKITVSAKAVLKIFWILGGRYRLVGWMYYLPAFLLDPWYRLVAKYRYRLFASKKLKPLDESRLLP